MRNRKTVLSEIKFAVHEERRCMPELKENIEDGSLSLCVAAKTQSTFKREDKRRKEEGRAKLDPSYKQEVIQSMIGKSTRECERKIAENFPESAVPPEQIRALADDKTLIQFTADKNLMEITQSFLRY